MGRLTGGTTQPFLARPQADQTKTKRDLSTIVLPGTTSQCVAKSARTEGAPLCQTGTKPIRHRSGGALWCRGWRTLGLPSNRITPKCATRQPTRTTLPQRLDMRWDSAHRLPAVHDSRDHPRGSQRGCPGSPPVLKSKLEPNLETKARSTFADLYSRQTICCSILQPRPRAGKTLIVHAHDLVLQVAMPR